MDVYLIPLASDRYELYCEPDDEREEGHAPHAGLFTRLVERFRAKLIQLDRSQGIAPPSGARRTWTHRLRHRIERWLAEKVAEQRLLWRIRKHARARVFYPQELSAAQATTILQRLLQRDADRHRIWMILDGVALLIAVVVLGPLFLLVPGVANIPAAYFAFRVLGHYLSMRGARHGLNKKRVVWTYEPCEPLTALRQALGLSVPDRQRRVREVAARLNLAHLPRFVRRAADHSA
jgi:hypothetical protein